MYRYNTTEVGQEEEEKGRHRHRHRHRHLRTTQEEPIITTTTRTTTTTTTTGMTTDTTTMRNDQQQQQQQQQRKLEKQGLERCRGNNDGGSFLPDAIPTSPAAVEANERLLQDIPKDLSILDTKNMKNDKDESLFVPYGMIVRAEDDLFFSGINLKVNKLNFIPASFLHSSIRAANLVFRQWKWDFGVGVLFNSYQPEASVALCIPTDGGTGRRPPYDGKPNESVLMSAHGQGCRNETASTVMCLHNRVLSNRTDSTTGTNNNNNNNNQLHREKEVCLMDDKCRCNDLSSYYIRRTIRDNGQVSTENVPLEYGDFMTDYLTRKDSPKKLVMPPYKYSCWYDDIHHRMDEIVNASNSMWMRRMEWTWEFGAYEYKGLNECLLQNANNFNKWNIDAIIIELSANNVFSSIELQNQKYEEILCNMVHDSRVYSKLNEMHARYGHKPVLLLDQRTGLKKKNGFIDDKDKEDCERMWDGHFCPHSYYKRFVAQPLTFADGSCLAVPDGCSDVYFFPSSADGNDGTCQITTPKECITTATNDVVNGQDTKKEKEKEQEQERLKKEQEEQERLKKEQEEQERLKKQQEEQERKKKQREEQARQEKEQEEKEKQEKLRQERQENMLEVDTASTSTTTGSVGSGNDNKNGGGDDDDDDNVNGNDDDDNVNADHDNDNTTADVEGEVVNKDTKEGEEAEEEEDENDENDEDDADDEDDEEEDDDDDKSNNNKKKKQKSSDDSNGAVIPLAKPIPNGRAAIEANRRLWEKIPSQANNGMTTSMPSDLLVPYGIIVRSEDEIHLDDDGGDIERDFKNEPLKLVSSSFVHASIRAPQLIYREGKLKYGVAAILSPRQEPPTRRKSSSSSFLSSQGRRQGIVDGNTVDDGRVSVVLCLPTDGDSRRRVPYGAYSSEESVVFTDHGQGCRWDSVSALMCMEKQVYKKKTPTTTTTSSMTIGTATDNGHDEQYHTDDTDEYHRNLKKKKNKNTPEMEGNDHVLEDKVCLMDRKCRCNDLSSYFLKRAIENNNNNNTQRQGQGQEVSYRHEAVEYGDFAIDAATRQGYHLLYNPPVLESCWYDDIHHRMGELINATNSLWLKRNKWARVKNPYNYKGYNECLLRNANHNNNMNIDSFVIELAPNGKKQYDGYHQRHEEMLRNVMKNEHVMGKLRRMYQRYGTKPVILLEERLGMIPLEDHDDYDTDKERQWEDCQTMWNGNNCANGFTKHFITQPLNFTDGSCLAIPPGCTNNNDVYYFPPMTISSVTGGDDDTDNDNDNSTVVVGCNIFTPKECLTNDETTTTTTKVSSIFSTNACKKSSSSSSSSSSHYPIVPDGSCAGQHQIVILLTGVLLFFLVGILVRRERRLSSSTKSTSSLQTSTTKSATTTTTIMSSSSTTTISNRHRSWQNKK